MSFENLIGNQKNKELLKEIDQKYAALSFADRAGVSGYLAAKKTFAAAEAGRNWKRSICQTICANDSL